MADSRPPFDRCGKQYLDPPFQKLPRCGIALTHRLRPRPTPPPIQPGWEYPRIVEYHEIIRSEQFGKFTKPAVLHLRRLPDQVQHARRRPVRQWFLGNQLRWKHVIEIANQHGMDNLVFG